MYKNKGYEAIGVSDHRIYFNKNIQGLINGCEYNCYLNDDTVFHLLTIDVGNNEIPHGDNRFKKLFFKELWEVQELIDALKDLGNLVFISHPKNPYIGIEILKELKRYDGIELFNTKAKSDATDYFKILLDERNIFGIAVDDSHVDESLFYKNYIVVEDNVSLLDGIAAGHFYSTSGCQINEIRYDNHMIEVIAEGDISIYTYDNKGVKAIVKGSRVTIEDETAFRVVCSSERGQAFSNKIVI